MASRWGFGWMGSKNAIAEEIVDILPAGECLVDLFAGGCAITHCAIVKGGNKWKRFIANDLKGTAVFFKQAIEGKVENLYEWISREDFFARRDHDVKVAACWSFGNNGYSYLYSREIEPLKKALYDATFAETHEERRIALHAVIQEIYRYLVFSDKGARILKSWGEERRVVEGVDEETKDKLEHILVHDGRSTPIRQAFNAIRDASEPRLESFNVLSTQKSLELLEHIEQLGTMQESSFRLSVYDVGYQSVPIPTGAVVYADPPYANVANYGTDFDTAGFWAWVDAQPFPVFVSEYEAPAGFAEIWSRQKTCTLSATCNDKQTTERLFVQERFAGTYRPKKLPSTPELFGNAEQLDDAVNL